MHQALEALQTIGDARHVEHAAAESKAQRNDDGRRRDLADQNPRSERPPAQDVADDPEAHYANHEPPEAI
jgi:hypothetical protein